MLADPDTWPDPQPTPSDWRCRWRLFRNRVLANQKFQKWAAKMPLVRRIASQKAVELHHLTAGFVYTQTLTAVIQSNLLAVLQGRIETTKSVAAMCGLSPQAAFTLLTASRALKLTDEVTPGHWMVGELGASVLGNPAVADMVRHHAVLYRDLADPLAILRHRENTGLRNYWSYVPGGTRLEESHREYSRLMSSSLALIADHILDSYPLKDYASLIDVAGGTGQFARVVKQRYPELSTTVLDLPEVVSEAKALSTPHDIRFVATDMFHSPLPENSELFSLIRVLHDHDDEPVKQLLSRLHSALRPGGHLLIAEPMTGTAGAESIGDTYFSFYLWAMGSGRPRTAKELEAMCLAAGFTRIREFKTPIPALTRLLVAEKSPG
ncbi:MAG: methyltransferase domain-containing protein [Luminiphilus sp.]|jgi:demethylspheroidene O-methyltransferase|nr:methyltransferase domain-containing protein [Luminiphilus sp.]MBT6352842.1 methyltransferase domain-containing protein [Halieaceae bacterium]MCH1580077.1 methyltransferase domain-containing protein [Luminiphilus sp.]MDC0571838.1 methyltransferase [Luminiphilus sp.]